MVPGILLLTLKGKPQAEVSSFLKVCLVWYGNSEASTLRNTYMIGDAGFVIASSLPGVLHSSGISIAGHAFLLFFPLAQRKKI